MSDLKQVAKFKIEGALSPEELERYKEITGKLNAIEESRNYLNSLSDKNGYIPGGIHNWSRQDVVNYLNNNLSKLSIKGTEGQKMYGKITKAAVKGYNDKDYKDVLVSITWQNKKTGESRTGMKLGNLIDHLITHEILASNECKDILWQFASANYWLRTGLNKMKVELENQLSPLLDKIEKAKKENRLDSPMGSSNNKKPKLTQKQIDDMREKVRNADKVKTAVDALTPDEKTILMDWFMENIRAIRIYALRGGESEKILTKSYPENIYGRPKLRDPKENSSDQISTHISIKSSKDIPMDILLKICSEDKKDSVLYRGQNRINNLWLALYLLDALHVKMNEVIK